jgi:uncharacterized protein DUF4336
MSELVQHADGLWSVAAEHRYFGLHLGTRMTVLRLPGGELWLHSVVAIDDLLADEIQAKGPVRHIVIPDVYHHVYVSDAIGRWPAARVHAPAAMRRKRPELRIDANLSETPDPDWAGALVPLHIDGAMLDETVFVHRPSRTLIASDLVENFDSSPHLGTRLYLRAAGLHGHVGWIRFLRLVYRDRPAARRSIDRLLQLDFDRIVLAHGRVLERGGRAAVREAFRWLPPAATTGG